MVSSELNKKNQKKVDPLTVRSFFKRKLILKKLTDQVIVITGASSGVGLATARMAAEKGAKVVAVARNEQALHQLVEELNEKGYQAIYVVADVGIESDVVKIVEQAIKEYGRFDTWVNNAGVTIYGYAMDVKITDMKRLFDTNFWGIVHGSRVAVNHFRDRNEPGALINLGSLFGDNGTIIQSVYSSSKHAVHGWTESLRMELEKEDIPVSVTLIHPGRLDTPYNEHAMSYLVKHPIQKGMLYPPTAVAEAILFAAEHPKRDLYIGAQAKFIKFFGTLFPRFTDQAIELFMAPTQYDPNRLSVLNKNNNLYQPGYGLHERGTNIGWRRDKSLYLKLSKHPVMTTLLTASMAALIYRSIQRKK